MLPESEKIIKKIARTLASLRGDVEMMTASEINRSLDRLNNAYSSLGTTFITEGRGYEKPSETLQLSDPLANTYRQLCEATDIYNREISRRYGPGAPSRLPTRSSTYGRRGTR
jgi:hypothetical protein